MRRKRRWLTAVAVTAFVACLVWLRCAPLPAGFLDLDDSRSAIVVDRHGEVLYEARAGDGGRSMGLAIDALPPTLVSATLTAEDSRFWWHPGIDPLGVARATVHNIRRGTVVEGGSTITQQVAKLLQARQLRQRDQPGSSRERGLAAKAYEAVLALRLEHHLSKREVLALYVNLASYGNQLIGAERASREYFGHGSAMLTPAQAAFLAALPQRPSAFNPYRSPVGATARQRYILQRMKATGRLSSSELSQALEEQLTLKQEPAAFVAPHFVQQVLAATARSGTEGDHQGRIATTLDAGLQREVEGIIRSQRLNLERHNAHNVAVAVLDNVTGDWLAWEGSGDYDDKAHGGAIDGVVTPRQPGSALKPFTYALAFESGESPATVLPDVPSYFPTAEAGVVYKPENYDGRFRGPLLARAALAGSENVPAVVVASRLGVPNLVRFLRQAGFSTLDKTAGHYGVGLTLGDAEVRLDEMVTAYAAFARGGRAVRPKLLPGEDRQPAERPDETLVSSRTAFWITDILSDDQARAYAFGRDSSLEFPFAVAAKTGTSQAYRDNWAVGYTRGVTVGVWVGNFDRTPLVGSSGVTGAGPIFHAVMNAAVHHVAGPAPYGEDRATVAAADGLRRRTICALSGMPAGPHCPSQIDEWTAEEAPLVPCDWHRQGAGGHDAVVWPSEYRSWARDRGLLAMADRGAVAGPRARQPDLITSGLRTKE